MKAAALQPSSKCGLQWSIAELISKNSDHVARWAARASLPDNLFSPQVQQISSSLQKHWQQLWSESKLDAIERLTEQEFQQIFRPTSHIQQSLQSVQCLIQVCISKY